MNKKNILKIINDKKNNNDKSINLQLQAISKTDLDFDIINELIYFHEIDLSRNMLKELPYNFKLLKNLKKLTLSENYIDIFPKEIFEINSLEFLDIGHNELKTISLDLKKLQKLKHLYLKGNPLKTIPISIYELINIETIGLVNTKIISISSEINKLQKLRFLWIGKNKIKKLPKELLELKSIEEITLDENPLPISKKIISSKNPKIIFDEYKKYKYDLLNKKYKSKIILVGESQAGKTSLLNRLIYNRYYDDENKTDNINIDNWNFHLEDKIVDINIWDFGGQDILYGLHKFFLTNNCIYILVWDSRNENQSKKIEQWLKIIKSINKTPKVLLVMNKIDEHTSSINKVSLSKIIKNIKFYNISCKNNWNIDKLEKDIELILHNNHELIFEYNEKYLKIQKELHKLKKPYITKNIFYDLCLDENIDKKDADILLSSLQSIGVFLYYKNIFTLKNLLILDVNWFIEGVYTIINWVSKNRSNGSFTYNDLDEIFSNTNNQYNHEVKLFIINALEDFNIIFTKDEKFHIPNLLKYYNEDIDLLINNNNNNNNYLKFEININEYNNSLFSELLILYVNTNTIKNIWRNCIEINYLNTNAYIYIEEQNSISIYIEKNNNSSNVIALILENFTRVRKKLKIDVKVDVSITLEDGSTVPILYLKYLQDNGQDSYISFRYNEYQISDIFGNIKVNKILDDRYNIYINENYASITEITKLIKGS